MSEPRKSIKKSKGKIRAWEVLKTSETFHAAPWVTVYRDMIRLPSGRIIDDYYRVDLPEYAMIYAERDDGNILFERQYSPALGKPAITLPTGCIEKGEAPLDAAKRELLEETGYEADIWRHVGSFLVDGNKGCGKAHFYLAEDIKKIAQPAVNDMEECDIIFMEPGMIKKAFLNKDIPFLATAAMVAIVNSRLSSDKKKRQKNKGGKK